MASSLERAKLDRVLLRVWREACQHIELRRSLVTLAEVLTNHLPIRGVIVREINARHASLETVAISPVDQRSHSARTELSPMQMRGLIAWCRTGRLARLDRAPGAPYPALPADVDVETLAGPLLDREDPIGLLLLQARPGTSFEARHRSLARALLEPVAVALENDRRLRDLHALREAAEADKRSLLTRLGRTQVTDTLVGASGGLRPVMGRVGLVARSDLPVLILGETGTGKEMIARAIHAQSARSPGPFIRVNCGAIPSELIDSQLFGHERGSFTGATSQHKGWFERADGGTLFLDEIGELPLAAQVRLLSIVQDGHFERVGGGEQIRVDVRVVAATHRDLAAMVGEGRFREDLWYRIAVFPILLPPLRERKEDVPALACHFAERAATRFGLAPQMPTTRDIATLLTYSWPGNIRELATVIDRAAILGDGRGLDVDTALGVSPSVATAVSRTVSGGAVPAPLLGGRVASLENVMREHIEAALGATRGRIEGPFGAAALLDINPHTLRARMRKLRIDWRAFRARPPAH